MSLAGGNHFRANREEETPPRRRRRRRRTTSSSSIEATAGEGGGPSSSQRGGRGRRRRKKKAPKKKAAPSTPRSPPKPLPPLILQEDWDGNDNHKEYLKLSKTCGYRKIVITVKEDQEVSKSSRKSFLKDDQDQPGPSQSNSNDDTGQGFGEVEVKSELEKVEMEAGNDARMWIPSGYKVAQLQFDRCSTHQWNWRTKSELLEAFPGFLSLILYVNDEPGSSFLHLKNQRTLRKGEALSERQGPLPKLTKKNSERELIFEVTQHYFFHVDPVGGIPLDLFGNRGGALGNRKTFAIDFCKFDLENPSFFFDVVLLDSAIIGEHSVEEIPSARNVSTQEVFTNYKSEEEARQKEDINWFYGQIKKYHQKEEQPPPDIPIQPSSLKPTLRQYQKDAVNWMLFREGCLDHCIAHSSEFYQNRVDFISAFLDKMYISTFQWY